MHHATASASPAWRPAAGQLVSLLFAAVLVIGPVVLVLLPWPAHDAARIVQFGLFAGAGVLMALQPAFPALQRRATVVAAGLAALGVLSIWHAPLTRPALVEAGLWLWLLLLAVYLSASASVDRGRFWYGVAVVASLVYSSVVMLRVVAAFSAETAVMREHVFPGYSNYRFFNHVQTAVIPLLAGAATLQPLRHRLTIAALVAASLEFCWLWFAGGRATMLSLGVAAGVVAILLRSASWRFVATLAATALAGGALYLVAFEWLPQAFGLGRDFASGDFATRSGASVGEHRAYLWRLAADYIREAPLLGIGPMHYAARPNLEAAHPHNVYLQIACEWGLPVAVLAIGGVAAGGWRAVGAARELARTGDIGGVGIVAATVAIAVDAAFSGSLVMPLPQLWIVVVAAMAIGLVRAQANRARSDVWLAPRVARATVIVLALIATVCVAQGVYRQVTDVHAHLDAVRNELSRNSRDNPRLWSHGWIR